MMGEETEEASVRASVVSQPPCYFFGNLQRDSTNEQFGDGSLRNTEVFPSDKGSSVHRCGRDLFAGTKVGPTLVCNAEGAGDGCSRVFSDLGGSIFFFF